jgi:hypothetical protein
MSDQAKLFELVAKLREATAEASAASEHSLSVAKERRDELLRVPKLNLAQREEATAWLETLLAEARNQLTSLCKHVELVAALLRTLEPSEPEQIALATAQAEALAADSKNVRALAAGMEVIREVRHRIESSEGRQ